MYGRRVWANESARRERARGCPTRVPMAEVALPCWQPAEDSPENGPTKRPTRVSTECRPSEVPHESVHCKASEQFSHVLLYLDMFCSLTHDSRKHVCCHPNRAMSVASTQQNVLLPFGCFCFLAFEPQPVVYHAKIMLKIQCDIQMARSLPLDSAKYLPENEKCPAFAENHSFLLPETDMCMTMCHDQLHSQRDAPERGNS